MLPALDAILGHKSAHSFATGPVIAEPARRNDMFYFDGQIFHAKFPVATVQARLHLQFLLRFPVRFSSFDRCERVD